MKFEDTMNHRMAMLALVAAALVAGGCGNDDSQAPAPPVYDGSAVQLIPENVLAAEVTVRATRYDSVSVAYRAAGDAPQQTPKVAFQGDTVVTVPVLGLKAATAYTLGIVLSRAGAADTTVESLALTSGALPGWIPAIGATGTSGEPGYLGLSLPEGAVTVDNAGRVAWYHHSPNGVLNSFQAHPGGVYTLLGTGATETEFRVLDLFGRQIGTLACVGRPTRFHDLLVAAGGDAWLLCDETRTMDLTAVGGQAAASVTATVVQHLSASGTVLWEWNAFDHFDITDLPLGARTGAAVNFTHGNGIGFDADGKLLLSFRSLNEVTKVDTATGAVVWRLGGLRNEFTIAGDPQGGFVRQHGVRAAGNGELQMLDNGANPPSRLARYALDETGRVATLAWGFADSPTTYTAVGGSSQYHPDGHATVSFGQAGRVVEVNAAGSRVWELTGLDGIYVFRAQRIQSLYSAGRDDPTR